MSGHCLCNNSSRAGQFLVAALPKMGSSEQKQHLEGGTKTGWSLGLCDGAPGMLTSMGQTEGLPPAASHLIELRRKYPSSSVMEIRPLIYESENSSGMQRKHLGVCPERHQGLSQSPERDWIQTSAKPLTVRYPSGLVPSLLVCLHRKYTPHLSTAFAQHQTGCEIITLKTKKKLLHFLLALLTDRSPALQNVSNTSLLKNEVDNGRLSALATFPVMFGKTQKDWKNSQGKLRNHYNNWFNEVISCI